MPYQNRVTPFGEIVATPERGTLLGNRGCLHDDQQRLGVARWRTAAWIACLLQFKGRHREIMQPHRYTELFFLDEVTALAAGHRPCFECRRTDATRFRDAWLAGNPKSGLRAGAPIAAIDAVLHRERVRRDRSKVTYQAAVEDLPDGVMFTLDALPEETLLLVRGWILAWTPGGYAQAWAIARTHLVDSFTIVDVLTPRSTVHAIRAGYEPAVHESADLLTR